MKFVWLLGTLLCACAMGPACLPLDAPPSAPKPAAVMALEAQGLTFCLKLSAPLPLKGPTWLTHSLT